MAPFGPHYRADPGAPSSTLPSVKAAGRTVSLQSNGVISSSRAHSTQRGDATEPTGFHSLHVYWRILLLSCWPWLMVKYSAKIIILLAIY